MQVEVQNLQTGSSRRTAFDYFRVLLKYLPRGKLWRIFHIFDGIYYDNYPKPKYWAARLLFGLAHELVRVEQFFESIAKNSNPGTTLDFAPWIETLITHEEKAYLEQGDINQALKFKVALKGGTSTTHWTQLCRSFGLDVDVFDGPWPFFYTVKTPYLIRFKCNSRCNEPLIVMYDEFKFFVYLLYKYRTMGCGIWWTDQ